MIQLLLILMTNTGRLEDRKKKKTQKIKTKQNKQTNENEKFVH